MNKIKHALSQRLNKKMQKELKAARIPLPAEPQQQSDTLTSKEMLKKYPKKAAKQYKGALRGLEKNLIAKTQKMSKKHSKRTTPGQVDQESPPAHIHVEGKRWMKNLKTQNSIQRRRLSKQGLKRK